MINQGVLWLPVTLFIMWPKNQILYLQAEEIAIESGAEDVYFTELEDGKKVIKVHKYNYCSDCIQINMLFLLL